MESHNRVIKLITYIFAGLFFGFFIRLLETRRESQTTFLPHAAHNNRASILLETIEEFPLLDEIHPQPISDLLSNASPLNK